MHVSALWERRTHFVVCSDRGQLPFGLRKLGGIAASAHAWTYDEVRAIEKAEEQMEMLHRVKNTKMVTSSSSLPGCSRDRHCNGLKALGFCGQVKCYFLKVVWTSRRRNRQ